MNKLTAEFLNKLNPGMSKDDLSQVVTNEQQKIKAELSVVGIQFFPNNHQFPEELVDGQNIIGDDLIYKVDNYEDINYIRRCLATEWYSHIDRMERYGALRNRIAEVLEK